MCLSRCKRRGQNRRIENRRQGHNQNNAENNNDGGNNARNSNRNSGNNLTLLAICFYAHLLHRTEGTGELQIGNISRYKGEIGPTRAQHRDISKGFHNTNRPIHRCSGNQAQKKTLAVWNGVECKAECQGIKQHQNHN